MSTETGEVQFARADDLAHLIDRAQYPGLTAITGRAQIGKTWVVEELARTLSVDGDPPYLAGFAKSYGQEPDLLLRAIIDLYVRWLANTTYLEQAKAAWNQQKSSLLSGVATSIGKVFEKVSTLVPLTTLVNDAIQGLVSSNKTLATGGVVVSTLQYEQARDLVSLVGQIAEKPVVMVLDQLEKSPDLQFEAKTLASYLDNLEDWRSCHIYMTLRAEEPALGIARELTGGQPGTAEIYELGLLNLERQAEQDALLGFLRGKVPATSGVDDAVLLRLIDGYPGVIGHWTSRYQIDHMKSYHELNTVAADAHQYHYREFEKILKLEDSNENRLAIRLAAVPFATEEHWKALRPIVVQQEDDRLIDDLFQKRVLEAANPPTYGHAKRFEAAYGWFKEHRIHSTRTEVTSVIRGCADRIRFKERKEIYFLGTLLSLRQIARELELHWFIKALCDAAASILAETPLIEARYWIGINGRMITERETGAIVLIAGGVTQALEVAKEEDDLPRRDAVLAELRTLATAYPDDAPVREQLAKALFNTLNHAKEEDDLPRRDALLAELRTLATAYPDDAPVREQLSFLST